MVTVVKYLGALHKAEVRWTLGCALRGGQHMLQTEKSAEAQGLLRMIELISDHSAESTERLVRDEGKRGKIDKSLKWRSVVLGRRRTKCSLRSFFIRSEMRECVPFKQWFNFCIFSLEENKASSQLWKHTKWYLPGKYEKHMVWKQ